MVIDETQSENYIDVYFDNVNFSSGATNTSKTTKRVNPTAFVSVDKGQTKTVSLGVWSLNTNQVFGQFCALKIK